MISEDLDEILALADRVLVMYEGAIVGERAGEGADVDELGMLMAGGARALMRIERRSGVAALAAAAVPIGSMAVALVLSGIVLL